jgi:hypothetical protein
MENEEITPEIQAAMDAAMAKFKKLLNGRTPEQYDLDVEAAQIAADLKDANDPEYAALFKDGDD